MNDIQILSHTTPVNNFHTPIKNRLQNTVTNRKINRINEIVDDIDHVNDVRKRQIKSYLLAHIHRFDFPSTPVSTDKRVDNECDEYSPFSKLQNKMNDLMCTLPESDEEKKVIAELFVLHVPTFIQKHKENSENMDDNNIIDEIDSGNFPLSPPHKQDRTDAFIKEKLDALKKVVYDRNDLADGEKRELFTLLSRYEERFSLRGENMGVAKGVLHEIETDARPFRQRLRIYSASIQAIINQEIQKLIDQGVIVPSKSPYASNPLLIRKPDKTQPSGMKERLCIDYVQLNKQTVKDSYPLPNIQSIFNSISRSTWFTTMDLLNGFWQVMIKPEHRHKTAFLTSRGLYEWITMPFGLCNAPSTFQRLMDTIILPEYRGFIETYIDDLLTHSLSFDDHIKHLDILLSSLEKNNLTVKLSKCKFAQKEVKFLGHIITHNEIKMNPESVETILKWERPKSGENGVKAIRGFLGMTGWYRKFIKNFSHIAKPLYDLTKKGVKWEWSDACEKAFITLRDAITKYPVLRAPDPNKNFILHTDASDVALGGILMQYDDDDNLHPIAYASKTLNDAQRNYSVSDREALAIVWALEHFNTFCEGHKYTAITDHAALKYLYTAKDKTPRMHRLVLRLQPYDISLHYGPGSQNHAADLLSRADNYMDIKTEPIHINAVSTRKRQKSKVLKDDYEVEHIVRRRPIVGRDNEYEYEVKWKGYSDDDNTWEPIANLHRSSQAVADFQKQLYENTQDMENSVDEDNINNKTAVRYEDNNVCDICEIKCENVTSLYVHRFKEHDVPIPAPQYDIDEINKELLYSLQQHEPQFRIIYDSSFGEQELDHTTSYEKKMLSSYEFVLDNNDILYCIELPGIRTRSKVRTQLRLCLPKQLRQKVMREIHEGIFSSHPGVIHMYDKLREYVWWPHMLKDVINYVKQCDVCQKSKSKKSMIPSQPVHIPLGPWTHIGVDHIGPLPKTDRGNEYLLVCMCQYIRYGEAFAVSDVSTKTTAHTIINGVICRYGLPISMTSDRGSGFVSQLAGDIYKELGMKQQKTTAYHPQSNGIVESFNKTLKQTLKIWANERQSDWDLLLPYAMFAYNTSYHSLLQETPFYLNHGRDARTTTDIVIGKRPEYKSGVHEYAVQLSQNLYDVHTRVKDILKNINDDRIMKNDGDINLPSFNIGDEVLLYDPTTPKGLSRKLIKRWKGPYTVINKLSSTTYEIIRDGRSQTVHMERIRKQNMFDDDRLNDELMIAEDEIRIIEQLQQQLLVRKQKINDDKQRIEAAVTIENQEKQNSEVNASALMLSIHNGVQW